MEVRVGMIPVPKCLDGGDNSRHQLTPCDSLKITKQGAESAEGGGYSSRHGGSLSSSASGADRSLPGAVPSFRAGSWPSMRAGSSGNTGFAVLRREANEDGYFRPIVKEVVERYLDCGNPRYGFALIRKAHVGQTKRRQDPLPGLHEERLVMFSCRTRGFCPSCHAKRLEEWGEWMRETLLLDVPHRQVVFTVPKRLRLFFKYDRRLLGDLCRAALRSLERYFEAVTGGLMTPASSPPSRPSATGSTSTPTSIFW